MEDTQNKKIVGFWGRAGSFIFNLYILIILAQMLSSLIFIKVNIEIMFSQYILITLLLFILTAVVIELFLGKSIGKYIFGIETIKIDNGSLTKKDILLKAFLKVLYPVEIFVLLFSKSKRTLANKITKTYTVWSDTKIINRILRIILGIASIFIIMNISLFIMSYTYTNTDIYKASTNGIESLIDNGNDSTIGFIDRFNYPALNIQILNNEGVVIRPVLTKDKNKKYLVISLVKTQNQWNVTKINTIEKPKGRGYSISYSSKK